MLRELKARWREFRDWPAGERFGRCYTTHQTRAATWTRPLYWIAALVSFLIGVVLAFIPGPAVLFFCITGALLATQSRWVACRLDRLEMNIRRRVAAYRERR
jgi:hypothetical protein